MQPITLFDKSFLQSLSVDESLWFDHFFLINVCPLFYVETLADLEKSVREGRTPEQEVGLIADKFPEMHGSPSAHHTDQCVGELLGHPVAMTGQIPLAGGRLVKTDGRSGSVFEETPERAAFSRWQDREILAVERQYAQSWRKALSDLYLGRVVSDFHAIGLDSSSCKSLDDAKAMAESLVSSGDMRSERMKQVLNFLGVPRRLWPEIFKRWECAGYPSLAEYAPYTAHVLTVDIFFHIALAASLISERSSNSVDIAYLFYLPFCMMFVSSDNLHRRVAPLFLRDDQSFVWGPDLKEGLRQVIEHHQDWPESVKQRGVISFTDPPPEEVAKPIVAELWRHFLKLYGREPSDLTPNTGPPTAEEINRMAKAPTLASHEIDFDPADVERVLLKRRVRTNKGSWVQVSKPQGGK